MPIPINKLTCLLCAVRCYLLRQVAAVQPPVLWFAPPAENAVTGTIIDPGLHYPSIPPRRGYS